MMWELLNSHHRTASNTLRLQPDGTTVEVMARRVMDGPRVHFVLHFADLDRGPGRTVESARRFGVGTDVVALQAKTARKVMVVAGPGGSGRATTAVSLLGVSATDHEIEQVIVEEGRAVAWAQIRELLGSGTDVLLRRAENITATDGDRLAELLDEHESASTAGERSSALLLTADPDRCAASVRSVLDGIGYAAEAQPLAATPERIPGLVKQVLNRVDPGGRHTMSPAALQSFVQWNWPGNMTELVETLTALIKQVPSSVIERKHLPLHLQQAPPRRHLSLLESAEREAIIKALDAASGNKSEAAELLGMGRTTLYRRLRQLGLDSGENSL
jgi:hypothetical protein